MFNLEVKRSLTEAQKLQFVIAWMKATGKVFEADGNDEEFIDWLVRVHKFSETEAEDIAFSWSFFTNYTKVNSARRYLKRLEEKKNREKKLEEMIEKNLEKLAEKTEKAIKESSKK